MTKHPPTNFTINVILFALLSIGGPAGCSDTGSGGPEPKVNMPQAPDMPLQGEQDPDPLAAAAAEETGRGEPPELFHRHTDATLHLVALDGTINSPTVFDMDYGTLPAFKKVGHIPDRKKAFFNYLDPAIVHQNHLIQERRQILRGIQARISDQLALLPAQETYMATMRERYRVPADQDRPDAVELLMRRVDSIPRSMILAQAAIESAWGTSRFAREANNIFGQWCFTPGCGLVPAKRKKEDTHEVAKFASVNQAISAYFLHINSHPFYAQTRDVRERARAEGRSLSGYDMVAGLNEYSARGDNYVKELRGIIRYNKLE